MAYDHMQRLPRLFGSNEKVGVERSEKRMGRQVQPSAGTLPLCIFDL